MQDSSIKRLPRAAEQEADMNKTEQAVRGLIGRYNTSELDAICEKMGIITLEQDLPSCVNGFTVQMNGISFIVLNESLDRYRKRFTKAHELGHIVMHNGTNTVELSCNTDFIVTKYEREADSFAAWLLMLDEASELEGLESVTAEDISRIAHIPMSAADNAFMQ